jgi:hypothetical protein
VDKGTVIVDWLKQLYSVPKLSNKTNLGNEGFVGLPTTAGSLNLNSAVIATFLTNGTKFNLDINDAAACSAVPGLL